MGECQVSLGSFPILAIKPNCRDTSGMRCTLLAPWTLDNSRSERTTFLDEAVGRFQRRMAKLKYGHSKESVRTLASAMQKARKQVPKDERWHLGKTHRHEEMASAALVAYEVMSSMLEKYGLRPTKDDHQLGGEQDGDIGEEGSTLIDSGANGVVLSVAAAKRKKLRSLIDRSHRVTMELAEKEQKIESLGAVKGGVSFEMRALHGRTVTISLPCHVADVRDSIIGSNEQGPLLDGVGDVMYMEYQ